VPDAGQLVPGVARVLIGRLSEAFDAALNRAEMCRIGYGIRIEAIQGGRTLQLLSVALRSALIV
jgi:hypothetical protein